MAWNVSGLSVSGSSSTSGQGSSSSTGVSNINEAIQSIAQRYCVGCKNSFEEMSKVTQAVTVTRQELAKYDLKQQETLTQVFRVTSSASPLTPGQAAVFKVDASSKSSPSVATKCFACTLSCVKHCLTILRALATQEKTHSLMLKDVTKFKFTLIFLINMMDVNLLKAETLTIFSILKFIGVKIFDFLAMIKVYCIIAANTYFFF